eukprot:5270419-Prymnesium_polylepis.1
MSAAFIFVCLSPALVPYTRAPLALQQQRAAPATARVGAVRCSGPLSEDAVQAKLASLRKRKAPGGARRAAAAPEPSPATAEPEPPESTVPVARVVGSGGDDDKADTVPPLERLGAKVAARR